jgi:hypothetical protein
LNLTHLCACRFGRLGAWITVQCPQEFDEMVGAAGGVWEPGQRVWLLRLHRLSPVLRKLRRQADPLFRQAGYLEAGGDGMVQSGGSVTWGDYSAYRCPVCGVYRISSTHETLFDNGSRDPKKTHFRLDPDGYRWLGGG